MIVPRGRLLFWVGAAGLPLAAISATAPDAATAAGSVLSALAVVALLDAALAPRRLAGLVVELPPIVRLMMGREGRVEVRLLHPSPRARQVRLGLALTPALDTPAAELDLTLAPGAPVSRLAWPLTARRRGVFRLRRVHLEAGSPLGFWAARRPAAVDTEVRVYPNLLAERRVAASLLLRHGSVGTHALRQVGKGREFEKLREYIPGDSHDDVHWKATAKRGRPVTKVFQIERTQEVYAVLDASRLSTRPVGVPPQPALELFVRAALVVALAAQRQGDLFGLLAFDDRLRSFVRARRGASHFDVCREALFALEPRVVAPNFEDMASFIRTRLRRRALLVFLTDLGDPALAESFVRGVDLLRGQHLTLVCMLAPPNAAPLFTGDAPASTDDVYQRLAGHILWHDLKELGGLLKRRGVELSLLGSAHLAADVVSRYVAVKQRQIL